MHFDFDLVTSFLQQNRFTSQFILTGLATREQLAAALSSNRLHARLNSGSIEALLYVSPTSRIHLEGSFDSELFESIQYRQSHTKHIGVNGPSATMKGYLKWSDSFAQPSHIFKETVFRKSVEPADETSSEARQLTLNDFENWHRLYVDYLKEMQINSSATKAERHTRFQVEVDRKMHWGLDDSGRLISIGAFNSLGQKTAQIGGVYTPPSFRRKGASEAVMKAILRDAHSVHSLDELLLFTGYDDVAPRSLYEKLGFSNKSNYWVAEF